MKKSPREYVGRLQEALEHFPVDQVKTLTKVLLKAYEDGRRIFVMGNGGSAATASHWACDINKSCALNKDKKFRVVCLNDNVAALLAYANDISFEDVFVGQLKNLYIEGDVVIAISGSGNSPNVLKAIDYARSNGALTVGLCGFTGGNLRDSVDVFVFIEVRDQQIVEDLHMTALHMCMQGISQELGDYK